jgi:hypothetical protein
MISRRLLITTLAALLWFCAPVQAGWLFQRGPSSSVTAAAVVQKAPAAARRGLLPRLWKSSHALLVGTFKDGPRLTVKSVKERPVLFAAAATTAGVLGAAASSFGLHLGPVHIEQLLMLSNVGLLGYQIKKSAPDIRSAKGLSRLRVLGAEVAWPGVMTLATLGLSNVIGAPQAATHSTMELAKAFAANAVLTGDDPAILLHSLRERD